MTAMHSPDGKLSHASLQQAAQWYVALHDENGGAQLREQWQRWFDQHAEHRDAWRYVERVGQRFAPLQGEGARESSGVLRRVGDPARLSRRQGLKTLMILAGGSLLGWSAWRGTPLPRLVTAWGADFATGVGETRETLLADGSHLWLGALSAIDADFSAERRLLRMHFGEVLVDTAKDPRRPFLVDTEHGRLRALGTRFAVRQLGETTRLNVYQGAVEVHTAASGATSIVGAGQRVEFSAAAIGASAPALSAGESWIRHVLTAEDMPLGQLVQELSRYRHGHLGCNPAVAGLPVMGAFPLNDTDQALRLIAAALPVRLEWMTPWWGSLEPA
ncbi:FecR family protein [Pseudomonas kuykendallii]|uniref:FecR family protein n=2 Tax=Pseudomonas kuykendallii TaxID=1007099 RepID=A0A1H3FSG6_9PSED|nr:FecR family protein [Pseudomonas kuykendallii]